MQSAMEVQGSEKLLLYPAIELDFDPERLRWWMERVRRSDIYRCAKYWDDRRDGQSA